MRCKLFKNSARKSFLLEPSVCNLVRLTRNPFKIWRRAMRYTNWVQASSSPLESFSAPRLKGSLIRLVGKALQCSFQLLSEGVLGAEGVVAAVNRRATKRVSGYCAIIAEGERSSGDVGWRAECMSSITFINIPTYRQLDMTRNELRRDPSTFVSYSISRPSDIRTGSQF